MALGEWEKAVEKYADALETMYVSDSNRFLAKIRFTELMITLTI